MVAFRIWTTMIGLGGHGLATTELALAAAAGGGLYTVLSRRRRLAVNAGAHRAREIGLAYAAVDHWLLAFGDDVERLADGLACEGAAGGRPQRLAARVADDPMTDLACATLASSEARWLHAEAREDTTCARRSIEQITTWTRVVRAGMPPDSMLAAREIHTALVDLRRVKDRLRTAASAD